MTDSNDSQDPPVSGGAGESEPAAARDDVAAAPAEVSPGADDPPGAGEFLDEVTKRSDPPGATMMMDSIDFSSTSTADFAVPVAVEPNVPETDSGSDDGRADSED